MQTAKKLGLVKGDFVVNSFGWPAIIISDAHTATPCCEVWGIEHECGSVYAEELRKISFAEFEATAKGYGYDGTAHTEVGRKAIKSAMSVAR